MKQGKKGKRGKLLAQFRSINISLRVGRDDDIISWSRQQPPGRRSKIVRRLLREAIACGEI